MNNKTITQQFIDKAKREKSDEQMAKFLADLVKFLAAEGYFDIITQLTDEDMEEIEKIEDEKQAEAQLIARFKKRTGHTPQEFVEKQINGIAQGYLSIKV